jgi:hypothetical protein
MGVVHFVSEGRLMPWPKGKPFSQEQIAKRCATLIANGTRRKKPVILEGIEYRKCGTCCRFRPTEDFYEDGKTASGISSVCRRCHTAGSIRTRDKDLARASNAAYMRRARQKDPERFRAADRAASPRKREKSPEKVAARNAVNAALKRGDLIKPPACEECGELKPVAGHHDDYAQPLAVRWLCRRCHGMVHRHEEAQHAG